MGKKKPPAPPRLTPPKPSAEEQQLVKSQIDLVNQLTEQGQVAFGQSQKDRDTALELLENVRAGKIPQGQREIVEQISQQLLGIRTDAVTEGAQKEIFDTKRRETISSLAERGLLNSTTANQLLGDIEKEKLRLLGAAGDRTAVDSLGLTSQFLAQNQNLFGTLFTGQRQEAQLAGGLTSNALSGAAGTAGGLRQNRLDSFNIQAQNAQAQYQHQLALFKQNRSRAGKIGGIVGAGLGLASAPFTAGLSLPSAFGGGSLGLAGGGFLGGSLGAGLGSTVGGLF